MVCPDLSTKRPTLLGTGPDDVILTIRATMSGHKPTSDIRLTWEYAIQNPSGSTFADIPRTAG
jgi:hypothetical protein